MDKTKERDIILGSLLLVLIVVGGYIWFHAHKSYSPGNSYSTSTPTNVEVTNVLEDSSAKRVPETFPSYIPVETANIKESYSAVYSDKGVTQTTVTYTSEKTSDALWKTYADMFSKYNFTTDESTTDKSKGILSGTALRSTVTIIITPQGKSTLVQINVLHR